MSRPYKHNLCSHPLYRIWDDIKQRCSNTSLKCYPNYGGRGIKVCEEWKNSFISFYNWAISNGYEKGLEIDREDNDLNYEPSNCRWVTKSVNNINKRKAEGKTSKYLGICYLKDRNKWKATFNINKTVIKLGQFSTETEALEAKNKYIIENDIKYHKIQTIKI